MPLSPKKVLERIERVITAWEKFTPEKSYGGLTLAEFKAAVQPSLDTRATIDDARAEIRGTLPVRDTADTASELAILRVVNGVLADPSEGANSNVYRVMGYVTRSERRSGLHRKQPAPPQTNVTPIAA